MKEQARPVVSAEVGGGLWLRFSTADTSCRSSDCLPTRIFQTLNCLWRRGEDSRLQRQYIVTITYHCLFLWKKSTKKITAKEKLHSRCKGLIFILKWSHSLPAQKTGKDDNAIWVGSSEPHTHHDSLSTNPVTWLGPRGFVLPNRFKCGRVLLHLK